MSTARSALSLLAACLGVFVKPAGVLVLALWLATWLAFAVGFALWFTPDQIRYFFPFLLFWLALLLPRRVVPFTSVAWVRQTVAVLLVAHLALIAATVLWPSPSEALQHLAGVTTEPSAYQEEMRLAGSLLGSLTPGGPARLVCCFSTDTPLQAFESAVLYHAQGKPGGKLSDDPVLVDRNPIDWVNGSVVELVVIPESRYVAIDAASQPKWMAGDSSTFVGEQRILEGFLSSLGPDQGIRRWGARGRVMVLEVVDKRALSSSLAAFMHTRDWRPFFRQANAAFIGPGPS